MVLLSVNGGLDNGSPGNGQLSKPTITQFIEKYGCH